MKTLANPTATATATPTDHHGSRHRLTDQITAVLVRDAPPAARVRARVRVYRLLLGEMARREREGQR